MSRLLVLFIDALRPDFLSHEVTPFLYSLAQRNGTTLHPILGYSDAIRATIYTGAFPDQHDYWMAYKYSPETSPFGVYSVLGCLDRLPCDLMRRGMKAGVAQTLGQLIARRRQLRALNIQNIPFGAARFFDYTLRGGMRIGGVNGFPTLFDLLRRDGLSCFFLDTSQLKPLRTLAGWKSYFSSARAAPAVLEQVSGVDADTQLVWVYIHHIDNCAHRYGIQGERFKQELRDVDRLCESVVEAVSRRLGERPQILCFSDHGMAQTEQFVDLTRFWQRPGFGRDYLLFLDSSLIQVWYLNEAGRSFIRSAFDQLGYGYFLTREEKHQLHIDFAHRYYGDDIYLLEPRFSIFPNFVSMLKPHAMHAYHPDHPTQKGVFIADIHNMPSLGSDPVQLEQIAPTVLQYLDLPVPATCLGTSLLTRSN